ncbi:MAG: YncE family protein [Christensenellales bacterium]|jgi:hypothetical protein
MAAYIYASMSGEDSIWVVDADRFVPLRVIPLPRGSRPGSLACNPREGALYCACRESVEVFDLLQGGRLRSLPLPGPDVVGMALSGANEIQLLSNESSCIATLDAQDGALYQVVPTALAPTRLETGHNGLVSVSGSVENEVRVYKQPRLLPLSRIRTPEQLLHAGLSPFGVLCHLQQPYHEGGLLALYTYRGRCQGRLRLHCPQARLRFDEPYARHLPAPAVIVSALNACTDPASLVGDVLVSRRYGLFLAHISSQELLHQPFDGPVRRLPCGREPQGLLLVSSPSTLINA